MKFDKVTHKVDINSMNRDEAQAFVKFLYSEAQRHLDDITDACELARKVERKFKL